MHDEDENSENDFYQDIDVIFFAKRKEQISQYKKGWYKNNAENLKKAYDPVKRREKYEKEKQVKNEICKKMFDEDKNDEQEFYQDKDIKKYLNKKERIAQYKKDKYKENARKKREARPR